MSKKIRNLFFIFTFITFGSLFAESAEETAKKNILEKFQQMFELKLNQGDKVALDLAKRAKNNAGSLNLEMAEMQKIMTQWDPLAKSMFAKLKSKEAVVNELKSKFEKLLKEKVKAEDPQAIRIAEKGEANGGRLELTVRQMQELISKWEK